MRRRRPAQSCPARSPSGLYLIGVLLGEEFLAVGKAVRLEEEAEQDGAVRSDSLMLIAGRPPDELARPAFAFVILERTFDHISLLKRGMLVQRHDRARRELEQRGGDAAVV